MFRAHGCGSHSWNRLRVLASPICSRFEGTSKLHFSATTATTTTATTTATSTQTQHHQIDEYPPLSMDDVIVIRDKDAARRAAEGLMRATNEWHAVDTEFALTTNTNTTTTTTTAQQGEESGVKSAEILIVVPELAKRARAAREARSVSRVCGQGLANGHGGGWVTCLSVFSGPTADIMGLGPGKVLWIDNLGIAEGLLLEFKEYVAAVVVVVVVVVFLNE